MPLAAARHVHPHQRQAYPPVRTASGITHMDQHHNRPATAAGGCVLCACTAWHVAASKHGGMPVPVACGAAPLLLSKHVHNPAGLQTRKGYTAVAPARPHLGTWLSVRQIPCTLLLLCRTKHEHLSRFRRAEGWCGACCRTALLASRKPPEPPCRNVAGSSPPDVAQVACREAGLAAVLILRGR
jgi:hypothetical protein